MKKGRGIVSFGFFYIKKNVLKDFSNETRGVKELKYGAEVMEDKLLDEKNLESKIKIQSSLSVLGMPLKFRALFW